MISYRMTLFVCILAGLVLGYLIADQLLQRRMAEQRAATPDAPAPETEPEPTPLYAPQDRAVPSPLG